MAELKIHVINNRVSDDTKEYLENTELEIEMSDKCVEKLHKMSKANKSGGHIDFQILDALEHYIPDTHYELEITTAIGKEVLYVGTYKLKNVKVTHNTDTNFRVDIQGKVSEIIKE